MTTTSAFWQHQLVHRSYKKHLGWPRRNPHLSVETVTEASETVFAPTFTISPRVQNIAVGSQLHPYAKVALCVFTWVSKSRIPRLFGYLCHGDGRYRYQHNKPRHSVKMMFTLPLKMVSYFHPKEMPPCPLDDGGKFTKPVMDFEGVYIKVADKEIMKARGRLIVQLSIKHSYPSWSGSALSFRRLKILITRNTQCESNAFLDTFSESISESPLTSDDELLQLSSPSSSSSPIALNIPDAEELSRDLAELAQLRQSVQKNLRLRPICLFSRPRLLFQVLPLLHGAKIDTTCRQFDSDSSSPKSASSTYLTPVDIHFPSPPASSPPEPPSRARKPQQHSASMPSPHIPTSAMDPAELLIRLASPNRPLLIDTCTHFAYTFITSDEGKQVFDSWDIDGDVFIVHGEETDERERDNPGVIAWALLSVLTGFLNPDKVWYLCGGIAGAQLHARLRKYIINAPHSPPSPCQASLQLPKPPKSMKGKAFLQLDTHSTAGPSSSV
ncbi:hypothetical protein DFJ58DRAFT_894411 [Suillus subalutaceus]|uniref:uncharacterized protein n=1 Tax=Suillus subalutaceus TaxID=48586 RepID=UPI001B85B9DE|nr:uncharacterized protein DFJ58DRAFT_894411 [Suillus subalutaceus]KAG1844850.1 hypothetical protein DFJ58DRAFT_894411 [Suillus subalutaceus]